jgi:ParB family chromosome partitioning protein
MAKQATKGATQALSALSSMLQPLAAAPLMLAIDRLQPDPDQPRKTMTDVQSLAESIQAQDVIEPLVVRPPDEQGRYTIIAGERRWRAAQRAGLRQLPVVIRQVTPAQALAVQLVENLDREPVPVLEEAAAVERLVALCGGSKHAAAAKEAAQVLGKTEAWVSKRRALLKLPDYIQALATRGVCEDIATLNGFGQLARLDPAEAQSLAEDAKAGLVIGSLRAQVEQAIAARRGKEKSDRKTRPVAPVKPGASAPASDISGGPTTAAPAATDRNVQPDEMAASSNRNPPALTARAAGELVESTLPPRTAAEPPRSLGTLRPAATAVQAIVLEHTGEGFELILDGRLFRLTWEQIASLVQQYQALATTKR